jgi:putative nucleotidyltransferase with HDIG domain
MRLNKQIPQNRISILTLDDDPIITSTIQAYFQRSGYQVDVESNPYTAIERVRTGNYDILLLDFLMAPICGDQVVEEIRKFNQDLFIILLTGHKSMAPPVKTIRQLDIQGYYEKNDRFDQLELLVESCVKSIKQMRTIREYKSDLEKAYMQTIEILRHVVESRDKATKGHSERVALLAKELAEEMQLSSDDVEMIHVAGLFHDVGKIGIPDSILLKNGPLTKEEFQIIKGHPAEGERIIISYAPFKKLLSIVRGHHEWYNGTGYPDGKAGEEICLGARIIAVADSFDAMMSNRTYRKGLGFDKTVDELIKGKGTQFDPNIVEAFITLVEKNGHAKYERMYSDDGGTEQPTSNA